MSNKIFFADPGTTNVLINTLSNNITSNTTEIQLTDASNFPTKGTIQIEDEIIIYTEKSGNTLLNCLRANNPSSHTSLSVVTLLARTSEAPVPDKYYAGWYKERGNSNSTLRVNDSNLMMRGTVRFNHATSTFQGFNGTEWVTFNAEKGDQGQQGDSAPTLFNFVNLPDSITGIPIPSGGVFSSKDNDNIYLRSIISGTFDLNSAVTNVQALNISQSQDFITLTPAPRPYVWDFSTQENCSLNYLKSDLSDAKLKAFGKVSKWLVKSGSTIVAGTAVRITLNTDSSYPNYTTPPSPYLCIEPYTYVQNIGGSTVFFEENKRGTSFLGIALESVTGAINGTTTCEVCTEGITTAKIGDLNNPFIFQITLSNLIDGPGASGIIGNNAEIYNVEQNSGFISNTPIAGYWLEKGTFQYGEGVLFYVKGSFVYT